MASSAGASGGDQPGSSEQNSNRMRLFAVVPKPWCEHLSENIGPLPATGIHANAACSVCNDPNENWMCLKCYGVFCSRYVNAHMLNHTVAEAHKIILSLADLSVWCYGCESYVNNEASQAAKMAAYRSKFGEDLPGSTAAPNDSVEEVDR